MKTILGREPAAWVGLIEGAVAFASVMLFHFSQTQLGLLMAAVTAAFGLYTAWVTHDTTLGIVVGLVKSLLALFAGFGLALLNPEQAASLIALVTIGFGFFNRSQTFPTYDPPQAPAGAVPVADVGVA